MNLPDGEISGSEYLNQAGKSAMESAAMFVVSGGVGGAAGRTLGRTGRTGLRRAVGGGLANVAGVAIGDAIDGSLSSAEAYVTALASGGAFGALGNRVEPAVGAHLDKMKRTLRKLSTKRPRAKITREANGRPGASKSSKTTSSMGSESEVPLRMREQPFPTKKPLSIKPSTLFREALQPFKKGKFTKAGRALTKHPNVVGIDSSQALSKQFRNQDGINKAAAQALKEIMISGRTIQKDTKAFGEVVEFKLPNGIGARFSASTGEFIGFLGRGKK